MLGEAIAARTLGDAGRRDLPTEQTGPRPAAVREAAKAVGADPRAARATKP